MVSAQNTKLPQTLENWLKESPFELYLDAGFFGFYAHIGFIKALEEKQLHPQKIHGASAGALVGAFFAHNYTVCEIEQIFLKINRTDFWDPSLGFGLLKGQKYHHLLAEHLPQSFEELKTPLEIRLFDVFSLRTRVFKSGDLCKAVRASSAFPGLFQPVKIGNKFYLDGGISDRLPKSENRLLVHKFNKRPVSDVTEHTALLALKNLPQSGPQRMHLAAEIISGAYQQTQELLQILI